MKYIVFVSSVFLMSAILLLSPSFCLADTGPDEPVYTADHYFFIEYFGDNCHGPSFDDDDDDYEPTSDEFPPPGWSVLATNPDSTWRISDWVKGDFIYSWNDDWEGSCLVTVDGGSDKPYNELLVTKKAKKKGCVSYGIFFLSLLTEGSCKFSVEISQKDSPSINDEWHVLGNYIGGHSEWYPIWEIWHPNDDFFDESKPFRVGFRYKGEGCKGAGIDEVQIYCNFKDDDDAGDYPDSGWSCGVGGSSVPPLLALLMVTIGLIALRMRRRESRGTKIEVKRSDKRRR